MKIKCVKFICICLLFIFFTNLHNARTEEKAELKISPEIINFGRCTKETILPLKFIIQNVDNKSSKVRLSTSKNWIHLSETSFEDVFKEIIVNLDTTSLDPGLYLENIMIESDSGKFILPIRLDLVKMKVKIIFQMDNPVVFVNEQKIILGSGGESPYIKKGLFRLPLRIIIESFGGRIYADQNLKNNTFFVYAIYKDVNLQFQIGSNVVLYNGIEIKIENAPEIHFNRTFVTKETISQLFNPIITYDSPSRTIIIIY
jgi:hypothetical protein